jgi:hypothetical protein
MAKNTVIDIYDSWVSLTQHIECECKFCGSARYMMDYGSLYHSPNRVKITACPVCNWDDLGRCKVVPDFPLQLFPLIKQNKLDKSALFNVFTK